MFTSKSALVVIDSAVENYDVLLAGVSPEAWVAVLEGDRDGVAQITALLQSLPEIDELHIVSHGAPGRLDLGSGALSLSTLEQYAPQLGAWFSGFRDTVPSLLLYGCSVAAGDAGEEFVAKLHRLTGADIAASSSLVGNVDRGGSWDLDVVLGGQAPALAIAPEVRASYSGVLVSLSFQNPVLEAGTALLAGAVYRYSSVVPGIDALVTVERLNGGAALTNIDIASGDPTAFQPEITGANGASVDFSITFVEAGTNTPTVAPDFFASWVGLGGGLTYQRFGELDNPVNYITEADSDIVTTLTGSVGRFLGANTIIDLLLPTDTAALASALYAGATTFSFRAGVEGLLVPGPQQFSLSFDETIINNYLDPVITAVNAAPVAGNDVATTLQNQAVNIAIAANDFDAEDGAPAEGVTFLAGAPAAVGAPVTLDSGAIVTLLADGTVDYDPNGAFGDAASTDSFTYTVSDSGGASTTATVNVVNIAVPNGGDGNADGILDAGQPGVVSFLNSATGGLVTLEVSGPSFSNLLNFGQLPESALPVQDPTADYPIGLTAFTAEVATPGDSVTVTTFLDQAYDTTNWSYRKFNGTNFVDFNDQVTYGIADVGGELVTTVTYQITDGGAFDLDGVADGTIIDPAGPAIGLATVDTDGDGVADDIDIDDDNDGILDVVESDSAALATTGTWTISGTSALYDLGNGVIARATTTEASGFTTGTFNTGGAGFWSDSLAGNRSLQGAFAWDTSITFSFEDAAGNPIEVVDPVLHLDRVGGQDNGVQNAALVTLRDGTWTRLAGTNDFDATATTVTDAGAGSPSGAGYSAQSSQDDISGTASGSLQLNGPVRSFTIDLPQNGPNGTGADGIEFVLQAASPIERDSDGDGIANRADIDSDNDGIPDNVEAQSTGGYIAPSGTGAGITDADGDGLDDRYDADPNSTDEAASAGLTPINTDGTDNPDNLDADSDNDGVSDAAENGFAANAPSGTDTDGDGLDDAFETANGSAVSDSDVNDAIDAPLNGVLPDADGDAALGRPRIADLDYRDIQVDPPAVDSDGDGVIDEVDLDDDNDGILDVEEGLRVARSGVWDVSAPNQASTTVDVGNGVTIVVTNTGNNFTNGQFNPAGDDVADEQFWNEPGLAGANSLENVYVFDPEPEVATFSFVDSTTGDPISVTDPIIHMDRLGGFVNGTANSATVTLLGGLTWRQLAGTLDFSTTSTTATDASAGQAQLNPSESTWQVEGGTASGSLQIQGTVSTFQLRFVPNGPLGIGDGIEFVVDVPGIEGVTGRDTDGDGIADHLDLDSDNDGISDLTESLPSGANIAAVDSDGDGRYDLAGTQANTPGIDDNYTSDGVATAANAGAGNTPVDTDTDTVADVIDLDADNDGIPDAVEAQATTGYTSPAGPQNASGVNATGLFAPVDTDSDATADYRDTNSDDDSLLDRDESGLTLSGADANSDGIDDDASIGASYADPNGAVNDPLNDLTNADSDPSDADFRSLNAPILDLDANNDSGAVDPNSETTFFPRLNLFAPRNPVAIATDPVITDIDSPNLESATITLTNPQAGDVLSGAGLPGGTNIVVDPASTGTNIILTGTATIAEYQAAIASTTFDNPNLLVDPRTRLVEVVVSDGTSTSNVATTLISLPANVDDQPTAVNDAATVDEDAVFSGDLSTNDVPSNDGGNIWSLATQPTSGTAVVNDNGTFTYTPNANFNGVDSFTYTITDLDGDTATAIANITINPVNDPPAADPDTFTTDEDTESAPIDLLANDTDADNDTLEIESIAGTPLTPGTPQTITVPSGTVNINAAGDITFIPSPDVTGSVSFDYVVVDGNGGTNMGTVTGTIRAVNDAPIAEDDAYTVDEDSPLTTTFGDDDLLRNDSDIDGDPLTVTTTPVTAPTNGTVVLNGNGTFTYTPNADFAGTDSFVYEVSDGNGGTAQATVNLTIAPINDAPIAVDDAYTVTEDTPFTATLGTDDLLLNDSDLDGDTLTVNTTPVTAPVNGTLTLNADGTFEYIPNADFTGTDSFVYEVSDGNGGTAQATVTLTVDPVNDVPVAVDDAYTVTEDTPFTATLGTDDLLLNDSDRDGDALTVNTTPITAPANGTVALNADGTFTYTPNADFTGTDRFVYEVTDGNGGTAQATVTLTVDPVNDTPVASDRAIAVDEETVGTALGLAAPTDIDGDALTITVTGLPALGVVTLADGTPITNGQPLTEAELTGLLYNAPADYDGVADPGDFTYSVTDSTETVTGLADITINPINDAPAASNSAITVAEDSVDTPLGLTAPTDADGDPLTITVDGLPILGTVTLADGTPVTAGRPLTAAELEGLLYDAPTNYDGVADPGDFTYSVTDGTDTVAGRTNITVGAVNDAPIAGDSAIAVDEESVGTPLGLAAPTDPENDPLTATVTGLPTLGTVTLADGTPVADGQTLTPAELAGLLYNAPADYDGVADPGDFTYSVTDGTSTVTGLADIAVNPINDPPVAVDDAYTATEDLPLVVGAIAGVLNDGVDTDADNDVLSVTPGTLITAQGGTVDLAADGSFTYTPTAGYVGPDSFDYEVVDGNGGSDIGTVTLTVNPDADGDGVPNDQDPDDDNDGILDAVEENGDPTRDTDGDGVPDSLDLDSDNDGIPDVTEAGGEDPDGDGQIGDGPVVDVDGDGIPDLVDDVDSGSGPGEVTTGTPLTPPNTDGTGTPDFQDIDADDDGIPDLVEGQPTADYTTPAGTDTDGDGLDDAFDPDQGGEAIAPVNTDGIDAPDYQDLDSDSDGTPDAQESGDPDAPTGVDSDGDGLDDAFDDVPGPDATDGVTDPATELPNTDGAGDVDYRDAPPSGVIINEWSQGSDGGKEWVEFLVVGDGTGDPVNLQNAVLADTNRGMARLQLSGPGFATVPVGTYLVIYNGNDPDDGLTLDTTVDIANGDVGLLIPSTNATGDFAITAAPSTTGGGTAWNPGAGGAFGNNNGGDVPVLMAPGSGFFTADNTPLTYTDVNAAATFYGILPFNSGTQGTPDAPSVGTIGANGNFHYLGSDATGIVTDANWSRDTNNEAASGNSRTPGEPNAQVIITQVNGTEPDGTTEVVEGGATDTYTIVLRSQPTAEVTVTATPDAQTDLGNGAGAPIDFTFTPADWFTPQVVTVTAVDDDVLEGTPHPSQITHTVVSQNPDSLYNSANGVPIIVDGVTIPTGDVPVAIADNEIDTDGDGIADGDDLDDDNDGIVDTEEQLGDPLRDTDGDGILDQLDLDADGDGILDVVEAGHDAADADGDGRVDGDPADFGTNGLLDALETAPDSGIPTFTPVDTDGDGASDFQDLDSDNDGINDLVEGGGDPAVIDPDGNGLVAGPDTDGDGVSDVVQGQGSALPIPDTDGDSRPDYQDLDSDNDGVPDLVEAGLDPTVDPDGNGAIDGPDADGDGISDPVDEVPAAFGDGPTAPLPDGDSDGIPDTLEPDSDNNGVPDRVESGLPTGPGTPDADGDGVIDDPTDSDGDGIPDTIDSRPGPYGGFEDTDGDGVPNVVDLDDDNDGIADTVEQAGDPLLDSDGDEVINSLDLDADNDGIADAVEAQPTAGYTSPAGPADANGVNATGLVTPVDSDGDGVDDYLDPDSDNDTLLDSDESGLTLSGVDANGDGIDDDPSIGASYADPDGVVNDPINDLTNVDNQPDDVDFRSVNNGAPVAEDDAFTTDEDTVLTGDVLAANPTTPDSDPEDDPLTVTEINGSAADIGVPVTLASGAIATLNGDGTYSYDPNGAFDGLGVTETATDSFDYTLSDGLSTDTAMVTITITGVNDPPVAQDDAIAATEGTPSTGNLLVDNGSGVDSDPDINDQLSVIEIDGTPVTDGETVTLPSGAALTINADGTYSYDPSGAFDTLAAGETGTDSFTYTITDGNGGTDIATATVTLTGANDAPVAGDAAIAVDEESVGTPLGLAAPTDIDGDALTIAVTGLPTLGAVTLADGTPVTNGQPLTEAELTGLLYNAPADYDGAADPGDFTYSVTDGTETVTGTADITVSPIDDPPVASDSAIAVDEESVDTPLGLTAPTDVDGDPLTITVDGLPTLGTVTLADGTPVTVGQPLTAAELEGLLYDAPADYDGVADPGDFTYSVTDGTETVTGLADITVNPINDPPVASDSAITVDEESVGTALGLAAPTDLDGDALTITVTGLPILGTVTLADGTPVTNGQPLTEAELTGLLYNAPADYDGAADPGDFTYSVTDGTETVAGLADITVNPINDPPVASDSAITVDEETVGTALGLAAPTDLDGDALTITVTGLPTLGVVTLADGTPVTNGQPLTEAELTGLLYDAPADYDGVADPGDFTYSVSDGTETVTGLADITVNPINDPPVASDSAITVDEESVGTALGLAAPTDLDGDALTITVTGLPLLGAVTLADGTPVTNGQPLTEAELVGLLYNAPADYNGVADPGDFAYSVTDGTETVTGRADITVNPINDPPVASDSAITVDEESVGTDLGLAAPTDLDGDALTITVTGLPTLGAVTLADGTPVTNGQPLTEAELVGLLYNAPADYDGVADPGDFTYSVTDGTETVTGLADITVNPINDPPVAADDAYAVVEDTPLVVDAIAGVLNSGIDTDRDDDPLSVTPGTLTTAQGGTVDLNADGSFTYTPPADYTGPDSFDYEVVDGNGGSDLGTVTLTVDPDADGDGVPDGLDLDDDNDGIVDTVEQKGDPTRDTDGDGILDQLDLDADGDGIPDVVEAGHGSPDADGDGRVDGDPADFGTNGLLDTLETAPDSGTPTFTPVDTDGDGVDDFQDLDSDNDGIDDVVEGGGDDPDGNGLVDGPDTDGDGITDPVDVDGGTPLPVPDTDSDTRPDYQDLDTDNDGVSDLIEAGLDPTVDPDGNGVVDGPDADGDGILDPVDEVPAAFGDGPSGPLPDGDGNGIPDTQEPDSDGDGVPDRPEAGLPTGPSTPDADSDGVIDAPSDSDGDGIPDTIDSQPGTFGGFENTDTDGDGVLDRDDLDDDNDGILDTAEEQGDPTRDTDGDGIVDRLDLDADNDSIPDLYESGVDEAQLPVLDADSDGQIDPGISFGPNGFADGLETSPESGQADYDGDGTPDVPVDTDGDSRPDFQDLDADSDGIPDITEAAAIANPDTDGDGRVDDPTDTDQDGLADGLDPSNGGSLPPIPDTDGDTVADFRDLDADNDGIDDLVEAGGDDPDGDGLTNGPDANGNGLADDLEGPGNALPLPNSDNDIPADFRDLDADNDGISDLVEAGLDPALVDTDNNSVIDGPDTDGDGIRNPADGVPGSFGDAGSPVLPDGDGDGIPDYRELDRNGDGIPDRVDAGLPTGPGTPDVDGDGQTDVPADGDSDGIPDVIDAEPDTYGSIFVISPGVPAEGPDSPDSPDSDGDGIFNINDLDDDNDGIVDTAEQQGDPSRDTDGDGIVDRLDLDADGDGIPDVVEAGHSATDADGDGRVDGAPAAFGSNGLLDSLETAPDSGIPTFTPVDTDSDTVADFQDLDADNDGINDVVEGGGNAAITDPDGNGLVDGPDTDGDGIADLVDVNGGTPLPITDMDGDAQPDYQDVDTDNDGIPDLVEAGLNPALDLNGDGAIDGPDADGDGIIDAVDAVPAAFGDGLGSSLLDMDSNGVADVLEPPSQQRGTSGADALSGGDNNDILNGFSDPDALDGDRGDDILNGGSSRDQLIGGFDDDVLNGGTNRDRMVGGAGNDILNGGGGNDRMLGGAGNDVLNGGSGNDLARGGAGRDTLNGGSGNDRLMGERGRDKLRGGRGDDRIMGGAGRDTLTGGQGRDRFAYKRVSEFGDVITDFEILKDRIDLRQVNSVRSMDDITLGQRGEDAIVRVTVGDRFKTLAVLEEVNAETLTDRHFMF